MKHTTAENSSVLQLLETKRQALDLYSNTNPDRLHPNNIKQIYNNISSLKFNFLHKLPLVIFVVSDNNYIWINKSVQRVLGHSRTEMLSFLNTNLEKIVHPDDLPQVMQTQIYNKIVNSQNEILNSLEVRILSKSEEWKWFNVNYSIIEIAGKSLQVGVAVDINDLKQKETMFLQGSDNNSQQFNQILNYYQSRIIADKIQISSLLATLISSLEQDIHQDHKSSIIPKEKVKQIKQMYKLYTNYNSFEIMGIEPNNQLEFIKKIESLTTTEKNIYFLLKKNYTNTDIATILNLSVRTVETHKYRIKRKLNK